MRLVKKILMSAAVVSAVAAMAAVNASAMTAKYNSDGTITLSGITTQADEKTLLVLTENATDISGTKAASVTDGGIIVQIDQGTTIGTNNVVVGTLEAGKTYYVRVGGDAEFEQTTFTVPGGDSPYTDPTRLLGDVAKNNAIDMADASAICDHYLNVALLTGDDLHAADTTDNGVVDMSDVSVIAEDYLGIADTLGTKTLADKVKVVE